MAGPLHPDDNTAAEYALGTLTAAERRDFERAMAADPALAAAARDWQERLVPLAEALPAVDPNPSVWTRLAAATAAPLGPLGPAANDDFVRLRRSRRFWRGAAIASAALAAGLALWIAVARPSGPTEQLVAVVSRPGEQPALLVRVDPATGFVRVQALATETPAGHSLELWSVPAGGAPRSLGLLGSGAGRSRLPAGSGPGTTLAVSVEPAGGSPTGAPTGPVVYSGRLVAETP